MKHARDLTAHTADGCDLLRLAEVGMAAHMIRAATRKSVTDEERATFDGWMDARRCSHLTTLAMTDDPLTLLDREVFASTCTICRRSTVLCIDEHKKFQTVECHMEGNLPPSEPHQFDTRTCTAARHLVMTTAISAISRFDSACPSPDFLIDAEIFVRKWNAALAMMGWHPVVSHPPPDFTDNPRLAALLISGILCETCDDVIAVELDDGALSVVLCPFDG